MDPAVANSLNPVIPTADKLKWADVFKAVSISGDEDIPINKRGSGVKRLVLLNFSEQKLNVGQPKVIVLELFMQLKNQKLPNIPTTSEC